MKILLMQDYFRGPDSTGLAVLRKTGDVGIAKIASHPIDLFGTKKFQDILKGFGSSVMLGHNRFATKGAINGYNAHPYTFGGVTGAHNGTLEKSSWDALNDATGERHDVDSMAIIAAIDKIGIEETVKLLQGAWALVWFDLKDASLNFLKNKERPLWYSLGKDFDKLMWASEWPMIQAATQLQGDPKDYERFQDPQGYQYFPFVDDWHYKFDLNELIKGYDARPKAKVKELKGKPPVPVVQHYSYPTYQNGKRVGGQAADPFRRDREAHTQTTSTNTNSGGNRQQQQAGKSNVVSFPMHLVGTDDDPTAGYYTKEAFEALANYGCSWCTASIEYGDEGVSIDETHDTILCADCAGNDGGQTRIYCLAGVAS